MSRETREYELFGNLGTYNYMVLKKSINTVERVSLLFEEIEQLFPTNRLRFIITSWKGELVFESGLGITGELLEQIRGIDYAK